MKCIHDTRADLADQRGCTAKPDRDLYGNNLPCHGLTAGEMNMKRDLPLKYLNRAMASVRDPYTLGLDLGSELIIDNFAGGGGTSTGLEKAFGRPVDYAINHNPEALAMHAMNHPHTIHLQTSVWDVNPRELTKGRLWACLAFPRLQAL